MDKQDRNFHIIQMIVVLGMLISLYLLYQHFSPSSSVFCNFGEGLDCGIVNKSPYSTLDGITYFLVFDLGLNVKLLDFRNYGFLIELLQTNAFLGFLILLTKLFLLRAHKKQKHFSFIKQHRVLSWLKVLSLLSIVYGIFLIYIQHSILKTYCVFCLVLDLVLIIIFIYVWRQKHLV
jgi:uncharacterized membrane protein